MPTGPFLPIDKLCRIVDPKAIQAARRNYCERCGRVGGRFEVHHIKSRGAGGDDVAENLINLCIGFESNCHDRAHRGLIPRAELLTIVAQRGV